MTYDLARAVCTSALLTMIGAPYVPAQAPSGVSVTLATKDAKTTFRLGQAVEVEFRFTSTTPGAYGVWTLRPERQVRQSEYDHFTIEPAEGVADPLWDIVAQMPGGGIGGRSAPAPLTDAPIRVGLQVNEWLSIRKPGHYTISAQTTRVVTTTKPPTPVPLRSNTIEIDVVAPEPGWAAAQLQQAVAVLELPDPPEPKVGQAFDPRIRETHNAAAMHAARTLRFLETKEAAQALARFYRRGPEWAQSELNAGLFASPHRQEVIAAMEAAVAAPDVPIDYSYLGTLIELATTTRLGPTPLYTAKTTEEIRRWIDEVELPNRTKNKPIHDEYFTLLADSVGRKSGQALAVSLETLMTPGPEPTPPEAMKALAANFSLLPEAARQTLLMNSWGQIASPESLPMLKTIAQGSGPRRDQALNLLQEVDPDAARAIIVDRVQRVDVSRGVNSIVRVLLTLPDKTLPSADRALVAALGQGDPDVERLIARYASDAVLPQLKNWVEQVPGRICDPIIPAYFFRVDPQGASAELARARQSGRSSCTVNLGSVEDLLMSPGLEQQAIEDLSNADPNILQPALSLLQYAGSAAAEKPILAAFGRFRTGGADLTAGRNAGVEQFFVSALLSANEWMPSEETFAQTLANCQTEQCRKQVASARRSLTPPIIVNLGSDASGATSIGFGPLGPRSPKQVHDRISQFPKGTQFYLGGNGNGEGSWYYQQLFEKARKMVEDAGMVVVDRSALPPR